MLPDELPFNIFQKVLRAVPVVRAVVPDYADDDYRKQFQDNWYGTSTKADLPEWLRRRSSANVLTKQRAQPIVEEECERESLESPKEEDTRGRSDVG